jgi:hypothetical protein
MIEPVLPAASERRTSPRIIGECPHRERAPYTKLSMSSMELAAALLLTSSVQIPFSAGAV